VLDFRDAELGALRPADYDAIGFICGLEVHQQLDTARKLFCRCPAGHKMTRTDAEVLRHMRPTLSEMGEYDGTALMEFKTRKEIVYLVQRELTCTYEIDDTPPFPIDEEAIRHALGVSKLFALQLVGELQVMRKQYLDGSIPTGFQRTTMVGVGGRIPFRHSELGSDRWIRIRQLTLEEDSCREVSDVGHRIVFRTDRLGMPLIETVTEPDLLTPHDVQEGARLVARVARASGRVRRGAGAARQDVNVSIAGSRRVEIKGVPTHRILPRLVHIEAFRHLALLRIRAALLGRGVTADMLALGDVDWAWSSPLCIDATDLVRGARLPALRAALDRGHVVAAVRLPGFATVLHHPTQPGLDFLHEISERVRVIACPADRPFLLALPGDEDRLPAHAQQEMRAALRAEPGTDAIVVVWGPSDDADTAVREVLIRAADALVGVPSETRQPHPDGTTGFERILPGPQRMYPDTDTPPVPIPDAWMSAVDERAGPLPWLAEDALVERGLSGAAARRLLDARWRGLFDALAPRTPTGTRRLAAALEKRLVHHWRRSGVRVLPARERLAPLVAAVDEARMRPEAFEAAFDELMRDPGRTAEEILGPRLHAPDDEARLAAEVRRTVELRGGVSTRDPAAILRWAMGRTMRPLLGRVAPSDVAERLSAALELPP
jgi:glutamyl-tRNA(Gln) amidotransferase subunit E